MFGTADRPRLAVFRSNKFIHAQLIDDEKGQTVLYVSSRQLPKVKSTKTQAAELVGESISKKAIEKGIKQAVFDRRGYRYHGRVKALAEGARKAGLSI